MSTEIYVPGQWNAVCMRCGKVFKSAAIRMEWTGLRVCGSCFDEKHPQLNVQGKTEDTSVPWSSPVPAPVFVDINDPPDWDDL